MMVEQDIFAQIEEEDIDVIWQVVTVNFDNSLQLPLGFFRDSRELEVLELIGAFRDSWDDPSVTYVVRTAEGVFSLYLMLQGETFEGGSDRSRWILHSRIREKENSEMLVDMRLKHLADFHGHLCPELVIGYRACLLAQKVLMLERMWQSPIDVEVENTTSALDAVQMLTGCTLGNGRLKTGDYARHTYTFVPKGECGLQVKLKSDALPRPKEFDVLERRVNAGGAVLSDVSRYWAMINHQVTRLIQLPDDALFDVCRLPLRETHS